MVSGALSSRHMGVVAAIVAARGCCGCHHCGAWVLQLPSSWCMGVVAAIIAVHGCCSCRRCSMWVLWLPSSRRMGVVVAIIAVHGCCGRRHRGTWVLLLRSDPTPTFSHTAPSVYTPSYETPDTWDCITIVSDFPDVVPAHPLDILPHVAPEPITLRSLMRRWPYTTHRFTKFCPQRTDGDPTELWLAPRGHFTHAHTLEHSTFC
jgi:hypothetical protein